MTFKELNIIQPILKALNAQGYTTPTPIQLNAIPHIINGSDILACAQTGTGKTAAFSLPILQRLSQNTPRAGYGIRALILAPTRELVSQIEESIVLYGRHLKLRCATIFGGVPQGGQIRKLRNGVDIVIATPGRMLDLMHQGYLDISHVETLVLDEADHMLDMGFIHDIKSIVNKLPVERQTLFFSATMPREITKLANGMLRVPKVIEVAAVSSAAESITQSVYFVDREKKKNLLAHILDDAAISRSLVFMRTKHGADTLVNDLYKSGIAATAIHGNKSQNARQKALKDFKSNIIRVLVATDIAARGIDIDDLPHVVNYELPEVPETYVHRIGRTGRAGNTGIAISFCDRGEMSDLKNIQKLIGFKVPVMEDHPYRNQSSKRKTQ